jgi:arylsulfatase A
MKRLLALCSLLLGLSANAQISKPNILLLYADDMGYGDLAVQNAKSKIPTPCLDQLVREGMRFTDGHSSSGICTPSRYAMLTGRHHWRKFHGIVNALGTSVFDKEEWTLPEMLQEEGYITACIGKWHLGWDWPAIRKPDAKPMKRKKGRGTQTFWGADAFDWSKPIPDGPLANGFDYYFGDSVINFPPYAWIENDRVLKAPDTTLTITAKTKEGGWEVRPGPACSDWDFYEVLPTLTKKAVTWIEKRKGQETDEFDGRSQAGPYGDFVVQSDWSCGQLLEALKRAGVSENTLVIFTADNGPERYAYLRAEKYDHWSAEPFRGLKRDIYEGGHHVPFVVKWPGVVAPGSTSDALVSQIDIMATVATVLGKVLPDGVAEDAFDFLPVLQGKAKTSARTAHVHNTKKDHYAIRDKAWEKRRSYPAPGDEKMQLFNISNDPIQKVNLADKDPDRVRAMRALLERVRKNGYR